MAEIPEVPCCSKNLSSTDRLTLVSQIENALSFYVYYYM